MGEEVEDLWEVLRTAKEALNADVDLEDLFTNGDFGVADEVIGELAKGFGGFGAEREGQGDNGRGGGDLLTCWSRFVEVGENERGCVALF